MIYEELYQRYGTHLSQRVRCELNSSEFSQIVLDDLVDWLEERAERAHEEYRRLQNGGADSTCAAIAQMEEACRQWRAAEDLAYLVAVANDVNANARLAS